MARSEPVIFGGLVALLAAGALAASGMMAARLRTVPASASAALDHIPQRFAGWRAIEDMDGTLAPWRFDAFGHPVEIYDRVVSRTYTDAAGHRVMLMLAYQRQQFQEERVHSPELCYFAQGFVLSARRGLLVVLPGGPATARGFTGNASGRREDVVYWIRPGDTLTSSSLLIRLQVLLYALRGRIVDGLLVRASIIAVPGDGLDPTSRQALLAGFLSALTFNSSRETRYMLAGPQGHVR